MRKVLFGALVIITCFFQTTSFFISRDFFCSSFRFSSPSSLLAAAKTKTVEPPKVSLEEFLERKDGPDFYWKYRLERLKKQKGGDLAFDPKNYPGKTTDKELYEMYYLDLVIKGKMEGFDIEKEQFVSEEEWKGVFKEMAQWTDRVDQKISPESVPDSPFELLEIFFPELRSTFLELESPLNDPDVPYRTKKELMEDAFRGKFLIPGIDNEEVDMSKIEKELDEIEAAALRRVDALQDKMMAEIDASLPTIDKSSMDFYRQVKESLSNLPVTQAEREAQKEKTMQLVEEMASLAVKDFIEPDHHHHEKGDHHEETLSIAEQFQQKYGRDLKKMQERLSRFNANANNNYLETVVEEAAGKEAIEWWKEIERTHQEHYEKLSDAEKKKIVEDYRNFLNTVPLD